MREKTLRRMEILENRAGINDNLPKAFFCYYPPAAGSLQEPVRGWKCGDVVIMREDGETDAELEERAITAIPGTDTRLFASVYSAP